MLNYKKMGIATTLYLFRGDYQIAKGLLSLGLEVVSSYWFLQLKNLTVAANCIGHKDTADFIYVLVYGEARHLCCSCTNIVYLCELIPGKTTHAHICSYLQV